VPELSRLLLRTSLRNSRSGSALLLALVIAISVAVLTMVFLQMGLSFNREVGNALEDERAFYIAEAGLAEGLHALRLGDTGNIGTQATPAKLDSGLFWVEMTDVGNDLKRLQSSAMIGSGRVSLEQFVFEYSDPLLTAAVFSDQSLTLQSNVNVDSFDSALGTYDDQIAASGLGYVDSGAVVLSNGEIELDATTEVYGDVHAGDGDTLTMAANAEISGTTECLPSTRPLPTITDPPFPKIAPYSVPSGATWTLLAGNYGFTSLIVDNNAKLTIKGPAKIAVNNWQLRSNTKLTLDVSAGPIEFYASGTVSWNSNSTIKTSSGAADKVSVFFTGGTSQYVLLCSNSQFYGTIYAAKATVEVRSNFEIFGAIAARQLILNSNVQVHFDEQLRNNATTEFYEAASWSTTGFPVRAFLIDRGDPFELIGKESGELPLPADAHDL
jgi:hypothetical protein